MGILADALSIAGGCILGGIFKERIKFKNFAVLSISIMLISLVGFFENIFNITELTLESSDLLVVIFALIIGSIMGDAIKLEQRLGGLSGSKSGDCSTFIDTSIFFGVGGLQICGPVLLATIGDNSQLILKSMIDFPFALMFGISYGKRAALSAIPVSVVQILIAALVTLSKTFFDTATIRQLCAMGYIILFFSGFNLICEGKYKVNNVNMIIGIFIIMLYNIILKMWG